METKIQKLDKILENLGVSETPDNLIGTKLDYIIENMGGGGGGGTTNYNLLSNRPQVNGVTLSGNKTSDELGLVSKEAGKGLSSNDYTSTDKAEVAKVANKMDTAKLENGTIRKIIMEDDSTFTSEGNGLHMQYSDSEIDLKSDEIVLHEISGGESRMTLGNGFAKLEGSPYWEKNPLINVVGAEYATDKSTINIEADILTFNNKDIATIDALQPRWIANLSGDNIDSFDDHNIKLLSKQIVYIMKNFNFMLVRMYGDTDVDSLIRNKATASSSGVGHCTIPIVAQTNRLCVEAYVPYGDEVQIMLLSFNLDTSANVLHFKIAPYHEYLKSLSWDYSTQYDAIMNKTLTFTEISFEALGGLIPFTERKTIHVN